jgi:hypothetical protein
MPDIFGLPPQGLLGEIAQVEPQCERQTGQQQNDDHDRERRHHPLVARRRLTPGFRHRSLVLIWTAPRYRISN